MGVLFDCVLIILLVGYIYQTLFIAVAHGIDMGKTGIIPFMKDYFDAWYKVVLFIIFLPAFSIAFFAVGITNLVYP